MRIQNPNESIHRRARNSERVAMLVVQNIQLPCCSKNILSLYFRLYGESEKHCSRGYLCGKIDLEIRDFSNNERKKGLKSMI